MVLTDHPPTDPAALRIWARDTIASKGADHRFPADLWATFGPEVRDALAGARRAMQDGNTFDRRGGNTGGALTTHRDRYDDPPASMDVLRARIASEKNLAPDIRVRSPYVAMQPGEVQFVSANLENMFHPSDDPLTDDDEMTPQGSGGQYTQEDYDQHRKAFEVQFRALNAGQGPHVIGVMEMEGSRVANDIDNENLAGMNYEAIAPDVSNVGPLDPRGIRNGAFSRYADWPGTKPELIVIPGMSGQRGVLLMQLDIDGQRVLVAVNHWKSMRPPSNLPDNVDRDEAKKMGERESARQNGQIAAALKARIEAITGEPLSLLDATSYLEVRHKQGPAHPLLPGGTHGDEFLDRVFVNDAAGLVPESVVAIGESRHALSRENNYTPGLTSDHKALTFIVKPDPNRGIGVILMGDFNTKYFDGNGTALNQVLGAKRVPGAAPLNNNVD
jgi:hypothetical protein